MHREPEPDLLAHLDAPDRPLATMALKQTDAERVLSPRCHFIVEVAPGHTAAAEERWVEHPRYGRGLVVGSSEGPRGPKLLIEFDGVGRKQLLHAFVTDVE